MNDLPRWGNSVFLLDGKRFEAMWVDKSGSHCRGYVDADNREDVEAFLKSFGYRVEQVWLVLQ